MGIEVEGERALFVKASDEQFSAGCHLLRGGGTKHLFNILRPLLRD